MGMKKYIYYLMRMILIALILYFLIQNDRLNFDRLPLLWNQPNILVLIVGSLSLLVLPLAALRWCLLMRGIGIDIAYQRSLLLTWIGNFFNVTLPGAVAGDILKGYYIMRLCREESTARIFTTLLIDRFVGLFGLIAMAFFALLLNHEMILHNLALQNMAVLISMLFLTTLTFYIIILFPFKDGSDPFKSFLQMLPGDKFTVDMYCNFRLYKCTPLILFSTLCISVLIHSIYAYLFFQIAHLIGLWDIKLVTQFFIMPIGLISAAIPLAPSGIGIGHAAFESLYNIVGLSGGADVFNLFVVVQIFVGLLGGIPYLLHIQDYKLR